MALGTEDASREASLHEAAARIGRDTIVRLRSAVAGLHDSIRDISLPRVWLESELIRLAGPGPVPFTDPMATRREPAPVARPNTPLTIPDPARAFLQGEPPPEVASPTPILNVPALTGDAALDKAAAAWTATKLALGEKSQLMALKLDASVVVELEEGAVIVRIGQTDLSWIKDGRTRMPPIVDAFRNELGDPTINVRFVLNQKDVSETSNAVELPYEGSKLEQLVKDTFGDGSPPGESSA